MDLLKILDGTPEPHIIDLRLDSINDGGDYNLGTPMYEFQKELTDQIVSLHYPDILKYCEANDHTELIVKSLEICINNCMLVSTHPYLLIKHYMPKNFAQKDMSRKLGETSGKFGVLKDLVNVIIDTNQAQSKEIGILVKNEGRFFDLTEALLMGCHGNKLIKRYCGQNVQRESKKINKKDIGTLGRAGAGVGAPVNIHLIPGDGQLQRNRELLETVRFDNLIVLDAYVDTDCDFFHNLRHQNRDGPCTIIRLVPIKTIEHCILNNRPIKHHSQDYLYKLILSIVCLREFNGNLLPEIFPIYNQKLTYLSDKFFKHIFSSQSPGQGSFPAWPLPELPKLPHFAPLDVEKSLLTEVHFHYTPYDSASTASASASAGGDSNGPNQPEGEPLRKRSYYESKRLELDYLTNPLKNNHSKLIGIDIHGREKNRILPLTHSHVLQLNSAHMDFSIVKQELVMYNEYETPAVQNRVGRRIEDTQKTLANVIDDKVHSEMRVASSAKLAAKKLSMKTLLDADAAEALEKIASLISSIPATNEKLIAFVAAQQRIWQLRSQIESTIARLSSKAQENAYVRLEHEKCVKACSESEQGIESINGSLQNDISTRDLAREAAETRGKESAKTERELNTQIKHGMEVSTDQDKKLHDLVVFLKSTSHLRKRKGRAISGK